GPPRNPIVPLSLHDALPIYEFENIIGSSDKMRAVYDLVARVSRSSVNVLLRGESGTGKEVFAKTIHYNSERAKKPFVSINCAALDRKSTRLNSSHVKISYAV